MKTYRFCPQSLTPMHLDVPGPVFIDEWQACWEDPKRDITELLEMATPFLQRWERLLCVPGDKTDIGYISLCTLLHKDPETALEKTKQWIQYVESISTVYDELTMIFIQHLRGSHYFPSLAKPLKAEWIIAQDFRYKLKDRIKLTKYHEIEYTLLSSDIEPAFIQYHADWLLFRHLKLDKMQKYLLMWLQTGYSLATVVERTHLTTIAKKEKDLCLLLKKIYSGQE